MAINSFINNGNILNEQRTHYYKFILFYLMQSEKIKMLTLRNEETGEEDQYALNLRPLGEGKSAKVYKATDWPAQKKIFAVKVIKIVSEEVRKDYLKELTIIKNLPACPNIVKTHKQHLESQNNLYIFQQYCESGTLATFRNQKLGNPLNEYEIYDLFFQTTNGLIFLLEAGIVHEDIKPANILKKGPIFKLCDFGVSEISRDYVQTTTRRGTISYMPPEKLKVKNFVPSDKSDIFSLGVCLYEIFFGIHPYLSKKTANYKEYLLALQGATLKPLPQLMKKVGSTSLKLENMLKFLERMIDLNEKTRANLQQLKQFLANNDPFRNMQIIDQSIDHENVQNQVEWNENQVEAMFTSVVTYKNSSKQLNNLPIISPKADPMAVLRKRIIDRYNQQSPYVVGVIMLLINSIDLFRKANFNDLNISVVEKNFIGVDLSSCKISRFMKYLIYQFSLTVLKQFRRRYEDYLQETLQEKIVENEQYLQKEFNKFLIECDFANKELLAEELKNRQSSLTLWLQIVRYYEDCFKSIMIIEENKKNALLSILYCVFVPKILDLFSKLRSIFSEEAIEEIEKMPAIGDSSLQDGESLLEQINEAEKMKKDQLRILVERHLNSSQKQYIFDIGQDSEEIEVITEEELL